MNTYTQEYGGTGGNISYTLGLLKTPNIIVAAAGGDFGSYRKHLAKINEIDLSGISVLQRDRHRDEREQPVDRGLHGSRAQ